MTSIVVIKNQNGDIVDTRGINASSLVDTTPEIRVKVDSNHEIVGVNSHITLVNDTQLVITEASHIDGGTF